MAARWAAAGPVRCGGGCTSWSRRTGPPDMRTLGLLGGMSWESTVPYYTQINQAVRERLGGLHSARLLLYSLDFHELERLMHAGDWEGAGAVLTGAARVLESAGAEGLVLCTNTLHRVAPAIE